MKPRISTFTPQRSSVRENVGAGGGDRDRRPRIEPELSSSSVTTVSRKSVSFSCLKESGLLRVDHDARQARRIENAFLEVEVPRAVCCAIRRRCSRLAKSGRPRLKDCERLSR